MKRRTPYVAGAVRVSTMRQSKESLAAKKRAHYLANKDAILARDREYRKANKEEIAKSKHERYLRDKNLILEKSKAYYAKNKERASAGKKLLKARKMGTADLACVMCPNLTRKYYTYVYKTCSEACETKLQSSLTKGSNNPMYTGGMPKCLDCDRKVTRKPNKNRLDSYTARCRPCSGKFRLDSWTEEEKTSKKFAQKFKGMFRRVIAKEKTLLKASRDALGYLGCSVDEAREHLEGQFTTGMSWENYGFRGWHIDHIRPLASFNMNIEEDRRAAFHYTNLQPLWWIDNLQKSSKLVWDGPHQHEWVTECGVCGEAENHKNHAKKNLP